MMVAHIRMTLCLPIGPYLYISKIQFPRKSAFPRKFIVSECGAPGTHYIAVDVMRAEDVVKEAQNNFIAQWLKHDDQFFNSIKQLKLQTMADMNKKVKLKTDKTK